MCIILFIPKIYNTFIISVLMSFKSALERQLK